MNKKAILLIVTASLSGSVSKARTLERMTAKQITIRDKQVGINYFQQGQGDTTFLFLHGWCIDGTYWKNQIEYFFKNSFQVETISATGHYPMLEKPTEFNWKKC